MVYRLPPQNIFSGRKPATYDNDLHFVNESSCSVYKVVGLYVVEGLLRRTILPVPLRDLILNKALWGAGLIYGTFVFVIFN